MSVERTKPFRLGLRGAVVSAGALAICAGGGVVALGLRQVEQVRRLAAEGELAQGRYLRTEHDERSERDVIAYTVNGRGYEVATLYRGTDGREALIGHDVIPTPRLGPSRPLQVVYLPADPAVAALRDELDVETLPLFLGGGFFAVLGAIFVVAGWVLLRPRAGGRAA